MPLILALALCLQDTAEQTFAKAEKKLGEGKSLSVTFKGTLKAPDEEGEFKGKLRLKSGDRFTFTVTMTQKGKDDTIELKSDGKTVMIFTDGEWNEKITRKGTGALLTSAVTRTGFMFFFIALSANTGNGPFPEPDVFMKASGFKSASESDAHTLTCGVAVKNMGDLKSELVVAKDTLLPKKYKGVLSFQGKDVNITEHYEEVSLDEIADSEFELKK